MNTVFVWTFDGILQAIFLAVGLIAIAAAGIIAGISTLQDKWRNRKR